MMNKIKYVSSFRQRRTLVMVSAAIPVLAWAGALHAQAPGKVWRVGFLAQRHVDFTDADYYYGPFTQGLRELGYFVGKNLVIEWRSAEGKAERLPELAAELVRLKVDVLATAGTPPAFAAQKATTAIPIVMIGGDPIASGLVKSLSRPGGNSTGLSNMTAELGPKLLELLLAMAPNAARVAILINPFNANHAPLVKNVQAAAQKLKVQLQVVEARSLPEIENAFAAMARQNVGALIVPQDGVIFQHQRQIAALAIKQRLPSISANSEYADAGGLMSYGQNLREMYKRGATYVDKILKGANPGELPVEQSSRFDLVVNMKTAKTLGIKLPPTIMVQATKVIE